MAEETSVDRVGNFLDTIFLLFLGTVGGMVGGAVLNCGVQKVVTDSTYIKHLIFFVIILFTNSFVKTDGVNPHPLDSLSRAFLIYVAFMMMMKSEKLPLLMVLLICAVAYILRDYQKYLSNDKEKNAERLQLVEKALWWTMTIGGVVLVGGVVLYVKRQMDERGDKFDVSKFVFGTNKCDSLKGGKIKR